MRALLDLAHAYRVKYPADYDNDDLERTITASTVASAINSNAAGSRKPMTTIATAPANSV